MQESYTQIIGIDMAEIRCPYHHASWRCRTQHILNCLRGRLLTRMQAKKFSSYVCVCPGERLGYRLSLCVYFIDLRRET